ncbi:1-phosphofructokinase [Butyrivibrio fibrisolvens]|jgi:1-phosphofructokinase|uniref:Tagatose-6-phosphate kinase n=1 Tax=Butyrivibrio fibrisolvens TaxID=831 RepID=A0A1H9MN01_BUTFI|nr:MULTISPECIES: 1-phosphofructokinase [Butyrivibrio]MBQ1457192.1 1-phosphofructokinase [Butyrivibrio sp.]SER25072.1 fructose-1-phosphate kinase [Butyrivibrio fibrisolvens]
MIYTVTFNPALDYVVHMSQDLAIGMTNRSDAEEIYFGGKGINVSNVLRELDLPTTALGFIAGFTGKALDEGVAASGITTDFIKLPEGNTRINVKIKAADETEINGQGPKIPDECQKALFEKLDQLKEGDTLVLAGSIPSSLPSDVYERILERLDGKGIRFVVDAIKDLLLNVLKYHPFLIKPNKQELGEMFGVTIDSDDDTVLYAKKLQEKGARNVLISMAGDGSLLVTEDGQILRQGVCKGKVKNSVGAGDSMVAGFIAGYEKSGGDYKVALNLGTACGGATAFSDGLAKKDLIDELYKTLN